MISTDFSSRIREQLAAEVGIEPDGPRAYSISMPFVFDDGDPCDFRLIRGTGGAWRLFDNGATIRRANDAASTDLLLPGHVERLQKIAGFYGLKEEKGALSLEVSNDEFSDAIYSFTQACLEITNLAKLPRERQQSERTDFSAKLAELVEKVVPKERLVHNWHHPELDPERVYAVDYFVRGTTSDLFLFGIGSAMAAARATIACYHYKKSDLAFKSVAIYDHEEKLRPRDTVPLNEVVDKSFPRVGEKRVIREFLSNQLV